MNNKFLQAQANRRRRTGQNPTRVATAMDAIKNPRGFMNAAKKANSSGNNRRSIIGRAKDAAQSSKAKDLAINAGGVIGGFAGGSAAGPVGALAGDNVGAVVTRRLVNKGYADVRAASRAKSGETRQQIQNRAKKTRKAIERLDRRNNENIKDQAGWAIGNAAAEGLSRAGLGIPGQGGAVAMRTMGSVTKNIADVLKKKKNPRQAIKDAGQEIVENNNPLTAWNRTKKTRRRGAARERLFRRKLNKQVQTYQGQEDFSEYRYVGCNRSNKNKKSSRISMNSKKRHQNRRRNYSKV